MKPLNWGEKIMHCGFMVGQTVVMATDGMGTGPLGVSWMVEADGVSSG